MQGEIQHDKAGERKDTEEIEKVFKDKLTYAQGLCIPPCSDCTGNIEVVFSILFLKPG